jgi:hypothetical protein
MLESEFIVLNKSKEILIRAELVELNIDNRTSTIKISKESISSLIYILKQIQNGN